jgi:ribose 5-phosphate isomerase A
MTAIDDEMREAARAAAALVEPGMRVGLGTGRTVAWLLRELAARQIAPLRCVATSPDTERAAAELGIAVEPFDQLDRLDIAIDGADQVAGDHWAIKGGHGAHLREKIVAAAADRFVIIVSSDKLVDTLHPPIPLELEPFGLQATIKRLGHVTLRAGVPRTPDCGALADYHGPIADVAELASRFDQTPGVAGHGLFSPVLIDDVIVGTDHRR